MKKISTFVVRKKYALIALVLLSLICLCIFLSHFSTSSPKHSYTIVIDAGHGGMDGGSVGVTTGADENHLNLDYAKCLKAHFENFGFNVVLTRSTLDGLYSPLAKNKKKDDMQKRKEIIEKSNADFVISIHMNSFPTRSARGAQVFYNKDNQAGKEFASSIQNKLIDNIPNAKKTCASGDYFIVNCTSLPAVIVECGYLSNPEEDVLLSTKEHRELICYSIFTGTMDFIGSTAQAL